MGDLFEFIVGLFFTVVVIAIVVGGIILVTKYLQQQQNQQNINRKNALQSKFKLQDIINQLPQEKQTMFLMEYNSRKKDKNTAVLLAVLLGGIGAHRFYLGETTAGVLFLLFSWTWIPLIIGIVEAFTIGDKVESLNAKNAEEILQLLSINTGSPKEALIDSSIL